MKLNSHNTVSTPGKPRGIARILGGLGIGKGSVGHEIPYGTQLERSAARQQYAAERANVLTAALVKPGQMTRAEQRGVIGTDAWREAHASPQAEVPGAVSYPVIGVGDWKEHIGASAGPTWPTPEALAPKQASRPLDGPGPFRAAHEEALGRVAPPVIGSGHSYQP